MHRTPPLLIPLAAVIILASCVSVDQNGAAHEQLDIVLSDDNGLPDELTAGQRYQSTFEVDWASAEPTADPSDVSGAVTVYASRQGADGESDEWPMVCEQAFERIVEIAEVSCSFEAPSPGLFALELKVVADPDAPVAAAIYTHDVVAS
jgi:hypothetical protein